MKVAVSLLCLCLVFGGVSCEFRADDLIQQHGDLKGLIGTASKLMDVVTKYIPLLGDYDNELCRNHSTFYRDGVVTFAPWALRMLDSSSKIADGVLMGNIVEFGNYDECLEVEDVGTDDGVFSGQHCVAQIAAPGVEIPAMSGLTIANEGSDFNSGMKLESLMLRWSICVPSSCRAADVETHLRVAFAPLSVRVDSIYCHSRAQQASLSPLDWFAIAFFSIFGLLVILSTVYDLVWTGPARREVLTAFSVNANGRKLLNMTPSRDSLPAVHGVRFLSMVWVLLGHSTLMMFTEPSINVIDHVEALTDMNHIYLTNATISVDSFLLLSGMLLCYVFLKEMDTGRPFNVPAFYLHRYIRLTPALAAVILFTVTLAMYVGDGPFWEYEMERDRQLCMTSWWAALLYVNNYVKPTQMCLTQSWYLAVDMQLFWLSPLILYALWKYPRVGQSLLGGLIAIGLAVAFLVPYVNQFDSVNEAYVHNYITTHTRCTPWLLGVGLGCMLHRTKMTPVRLSAATVVIGWLLSAALLLTSLMLAYRFNQPGYVIEPVFQPLYVSLMRPAWALGLAWVIYACLKGYGGFVNSILSCRCFMVLGRLTYSIYLVHLPIQNMRFAATKTPQYLSERVMYEQFFVNLVFSLLVATALSLTFEAPYIVLEKHLFQMFAKKRSRTLTNSISDTLDLNTKENMSYDNALYLVETKAHESAKVGL